jgi:hypothetical protein
MKTVPLNETVFRTRPLAAGSHATLKSCESGVLQSREGHYRALVVQQLVNLPPFFASQLKYDSRQLCSAIAALGPSHQLRGEAKSMARRLHGRVESLIANSRVQVGAQTCTRLLAFGEI